MDSTWNIAPIFREPKSKTNYKNKINIHLSKLNNQLIDVWHSLSVAVPLNCSSIFASSIKRNRNVCKYTNTLYTLETSRDVQINIYIDYVFIVFSFYLLITMATASFRTLSPKTRAYRLTSTCKALNIANIVNGSWKQKPKNLYQYYRITWHFSISKQWHVV